MRIKGGLAGSLAALLVLAAPAVADARPRVAKLVDLSDKPGQITRGPGGTFWAIVEGGKLARVRPNGDVTEFEPAAFGTPIGITLGQNGSLWATQANEVVEIDPADPEGAVATPVAAITDPRRIVRGPQGKLWTASGDNLVSFAPEDPAGFDERTIDGMAARGIAAADGKVWIADFGGQRIVRVKPGGGVRSYAVGGGPQEVARGARNRVALTNQGADPHKVGRIVKNKARQRQVPDTDPFGITFAAGNWWVANFGSHNLTMLPPKGKPKQRFNQLPDNSGPRWITAGKRGSLGVSLENANQIALIKGLKR